jgi:ATP-binding cassette subfamily B protein
MKSRKNLIFRTGMTLSKKQILSYLWQSIKPYKWHVFVILQAPMVASCFVPVTQYAIKITIDLLATNSSFVFNDLLLPISLFIFGQAIAEISWSISNIVNYKTIVFIKEHITNRVYSYVINHCYKFFQDNYAGSISNKIYNIQHVSNKLFENIKFNIINRLTILISTVFLFSIVSKIFVFSILIFYVLFFSIVYRLSRKLHSLSENYTYHSQRTSGLIADSISNIYSIFIFANKNNERKFIKENLKGQVNSEQCMLKYESYLQLFIGITYFSITVGVLFLLIHLKQKNQITIGDFSLVLGALFHTLEVSYSLVTNITSLVKDWGELQESFKVFNTEHEFHDKTSAKDLQIKSPSIEFKNVSFGYLNDEQVLTNFSLKINPGEKIGLVGHSGAGKSTLINLILRNFRINSGHILIDMQDIDNVTEDSLRNNISLVPQEAILFHRSIRENISYGKFNATEEELVTVSKKAHIYDFIQTLPDGFDTIVGERGTKISGGQRQRIAIARAFLKNSSILILDEATSSLDSQSEKEIQKSIDSLIENKTVIAVAHRLSTLKNMNRIIFLEKGQIIEEGTHDELIKNPHSAYKKLWDLQSISTKLG